LIKPIVQFIEVDAEHVDQRVDNFLLTRLKGVPKSLLYRLLRKGEIRVNKKRTKAYYKLQEKDVIRVAPIRAAEKTQVAKPSEAQLEKLSKQIVYEDANLLVLNKSTGLAVHGGSGVSLGVIELLRAMRPEARFLELAHRLDRDTSGCLIIAKKRKALKEIHELLREGKIRKVYYALTLGRWYKVKNLVNLPLKKDVLKSGERVVKAVKDGKKALTEFNVLRNFSLASFVEVILHTGRTHQIRVHAQATGHFIAGDEKYGDRAFNKMMRQKGLRRLFLHAGELQFTLPSSGELISVVIPISDELQKVLKALE
jgi:23S rRNA pseudouridine955/2504/2580 synthase